MQAGRSGIFEFLELEYWWVWLLFRCFHSHRTQHKQKTWIRSPLSGKKKKMHSLLMMNPMIPIHVSPASLYSRNVRWNMQVGLSGIFEFLEYWWVRLLFRCFHSHRTHKKNLSSPTSIYLVKTKQKTKVHSLLMMNPMIASDTCPMIPIHICATIHKLNCFYY